MKSFNGRKRCRLLRLKKATLSFSQGQLWLPNHWPKNFAWHDPLHKECAWPIVWDAVLKDLCLSFLSFSIIFIVSWGHHSSILSFWSSCIASSRLLSAFSNLANHHGQCTILFHLTRCSSLDIFLSWWKNHLIHRYHLLHHLTHFNYHLRCYGQSCVRLFIMPNRVTFLLDSPFSIHLVLSSWSQSLSLSPLTFYQQVSILSLPPL